MKKIGRGWQYVVYDLGNGRVRKERQSSLLQYLFICRDTFFEAWGFPFLHARREQKRVCRDEQEAVAHLKSLRNFDWSLLGNPTFISDSVYEQDKVTDLDTVFKNASLEEAKAVFDKFLALLYKTWEYGFSDKIFNFSINNGLSKTGEVIQLDFGELCFDKDSVREKIKNQYWLKQSSYRRLQRGELKEYYRNIMNPELLLQKLDELWGRKL